MVFCACQSNGFFLRVYVFVSEQKYARICLRRPIGVRLGCASILRLMSECQTRET